MSGDSPYKYRKGKITAGAKRLAAKSDINSYLTKPQEAAITSREAKIRDRATEKAFLIDEKGNVVGESKRGSSNRTTMATIRGANYSESVLTHNHPSKNMGESPSIGKAIGTTLSRADIRSAVSLNLKGIRSVTNSYTYNVERGKNGWGGSPNELYNTWANAHKDFSTRKPYSSYVNKGRTRAEREQRHARWNVLANHYAMTTLAEKYGLKYTRARTR